MANVYGLVTDSKKFGTGSLYAPYNTSLTKRFVINAITPATGDFSIGTNEDFYISAYIRYGDINVRTNGAQYPIIRYGTSTSGWEIGLRITMIGDGLQPIPYFQYNNTRITTTFNGSNGDKISPTRNNFDQYVIYRSAGVIYFQFRNVNTGINVAGQSQSTAFTQANFTGAIGTSATGGITLGSTQPVITTTGAVNGAWIDELFFARGVSQVYNVLGTGEINDGGRATTEFLYRFDGNYVDDITGPATGYTQQAQAALSGLRGSLVANVRNIPADRPLYNTTQALIHFDSSPLVDSTTSGVPATVGAVNFSPIKFSQGLEVGANSGWGEQTNILLNTTDTFVADFWYRYDGDAQNFGIIDGNIFYMSNTEGTIDYTYGGTTQPRSVTLNINIYSYERHTFGLNPNPDYNWGMTTGQIWVAWPATSIPGPPSNQRGRILTIGSVNHFLVSRSSTGVYRLFVNGTLENTWSYTTNTQPTTPAFIGTAINNGFAGVIDEVRVRKGITQTTNFTPPTSAYTDTYYSVAKNVVSDVTATFTQTANVQKTKFVSAVLQPRFTATATAIRVKIIQASVTARTTVTAQPSNRTRQIPAALTARTTVTANAMRAFVTSAALTSTSTITTQVKQFKGTRVPLVSTSTLVPSAIKTSVARSNLTAFAVQVTVDIGTKVGRAALATTSTIQVSARRLRDNPVQLASTSTIATAARKTSRPQVQLTSTSTIVPNNTRVRNNLADLQVQAFELSINRKITDTRADLNARFTLDANVYILQYSLTNVVSTFTAQINPVLTRQFRSAIISPSQLVVNGGYVRGAFANLQVQAFELAIGSRFTLEPRLQKIVEQETRIYLVKPEDRRLEIYSDGILKIKPETRLLPVKESDPVNTIPGIKL